MKEKRYHICLSVPIGQRSGTMLLRESDGELNGWIEVMEHRNLFSGCLCEDGRINLLGSIQTLVSSIRYTAVGTVSGKQILLNLTTQSGDSYSVSGEEFAENDEIL